MPREFSRSRRVAESIQRCLAPVVSAQGRDLGVGMLTITGVDVSPDLRSANVYVSCLGGAVDKAKVISGLVANLGELRHQVAIGLKLRTVPRLTIKYDESAERSERLSGLLAESRDSGDEPVQQDD